MDLEKKAYLIGEELKSEAAVAQRAYNHVLEAEEGDPSFHYMRGICREKIERCDRLYEDGEVILEAAEDLGIKTEKEAEEEYRMKLNQPFDYPEVERYSDEINEALNSHLECVEEATISDIVGWSSGLSNLRSHMMDYSEFLEIIEEDEILEREADIQERFKKPDQAEILHQA
jgi:hypothetical protein